MGISPESCAPTAEAPTLSHCSKRRGTYFHGFYDRRTVIRPHIMHRAKHNDLLRRICVEECFFRLVGMIHIYGQVILYTRWPLFKQHVLVPQWGTRGKGGGQQGVQWPI